MAKVMLVFQGYEWRCPDCGNYTVESTAKLSSVKCTHCSAEHQVDNIVRSDAVVRAGRRG